MPGIGDCELPVEEVVYQFVKELTNVKIDCLLFVLKADNFRMDVP